MENNNLSAKLNKFTTLVLDDARRKSDEIIAGSEKEYVGRIDERETEMLEDAYQNIQSSIRLARKEANERVLQTELEARRRLILKREEIIEDIINNTKKKLTEYSESADYEAWLIKKTEAAFKEVGQGRKTVLIAPSDIRFKDKIERLGTNYPVEVTVVKDRDFLGGVRVINTDRRVAVDYSFKELLALEKRNFLRNSGLSL